MMFRIISCFLAFAAVANSFSSKPIPRYNKADLVSTNGGFLAAAALAIVLAGDPSPAHASSTAAQISLNSVPPTTVKIDIKDLPVIGNIVSGTYTKVDDATASPASVSIKSPKDKLKAIQAAATTGHLEFDVNGLLATHLDLDIATNQAGEATIKIASPLIPKLPFKNKASGDMCVQATGKKTDWYKMTNVGSGESYYYNEKTGVSQIAAPAI